MRNNGNRVTGPFFMVVILIMTLVPIHSYGETGVVATESPSPANVTITQAMDDLSVGLGADPITMDLGGRFDDPAFAFARFDTVLGVIDVKLFQAETPLTVANFLNYVKKGAYANSFIHRTAINLDDPNNPFIVVQGGGFAFHDFEDPDPETTDYVRIPTDPPVPNEPGISNLRGTIAMAKVSGDPDSATSQWFFNVVDNSGPPAYLDTQNGGFTVFGEVINEGMDVVDAVALVQRYNAVGFLNNGAFGELPLIDYANIGIRPDENDLVMVWTIEQLPELSFTVQTDRPDLVAASVEGDALHLSFAERQSGSANITVRATAMDERFVEDVFTVTIEEWGDLNGDGEVNLADAVLALSVDAGMHPPELRSDYAPADVNGDGRAGMSEAFYVLHKVSGLRQ